MEDVILGLAKKIVKDEIKRQLYNQEWLRNNPAPYTVAITAESNAIRAEFMHQIGYQGELKKKVIMLEVDEKLMNGLMGLKREFKCLFAENNGDSLPGLARRVAQVEFEIRGGGDVSVSINKALVDLNRRVEIVENSALNQQVNREAGSGRCCEHCREHYLEFKLVRKNLEDMEAVKTNLNVLLQQLWNPKKGEIDLKKIWKFCKWAGPQIEAITGMAIPVAAAAEQPRENTCSCDQNAINELTTSVGGHEKRIEKVESIFPQLCAMWDFYKDLEKHGLLNLKDYLDAEFDRDRGRLSALETKVGDETIQSSVDAAVEKAMTKHKADSEKEISDMKKSMKKDLDNAVANIKFTNNGEILKMKESMKKDVQDAVAKVKSDNEKEIKRQVDAAVSESKSAYEQEVKDMKESMKAEVKSAVADAVAEKDGEIQDLKTKHETLRNEFETQKKRIEEQEKEIAAHGRQFEALATEQQEQNSRLDSLEQQRQQSSGGQNSTGPEQQQPPRPPQPPQSPSSTHPAPQGNGTFTPSPSPTHEGSKDNQDTPDHPMDVEGMDDDAAQSEADMLDCEFEFEDVVMDEAAGDAAQAAREGAPSPTIQPPTQPAPPHTPIFGEQPPAQPQQAGAEQQQLFGQGPASSHSGPAEPQTPAAAPAPSSIFGNVGQASASDPNIQWGAKLGTFSFADLNKPLANPTAPEHSMPPADPAPFNPFAFQPAGNMASSSGSTPSAPFGAPSAPSGSSLFPAAAPAGDFGFNMPPPPVAANPMASSSQWGAGFDRMHINGQLKPIAGPGQELNAQGLPIIKPRSNKFKSNTQPPASDPPAVPSAQPRRRNFQAYVEDASEEDQDVHMGGQGAGHNATPAAPAAPTHKQPAPVPTQQPSTSNPTPPQAPVQQQQAPQNTKYSLAVYQQWKSDLLARHADFSSVTGRPLADPGAQQRQNRVWQDNLAMRQRTHGDTNHLLNSLRLSPAARGFGKFEMGRLMNTWIMRVFYAAATDTSSRDQDRLALQRAYGQLSDEAKVWLSHQRADVA